MKSPFGKNLIIWALIFFAAISIVQWLNVDTQRAQAGAEVSYSEFLNLVDAGSLQQVTMRDRALSSTLEDGTEVRARAPYDPDLVKDLRARNVDIRVEEASNGSPLMTVLLSWLPWLVFIGIWIYFMRQMQGGGSKGGGMGPFSFGKSRANMLTEDQVKYRFKDVAGVEEAKEDLSEVVDFLKDPSRFQKLGGRIPKGVLLVGSPGTGKTLLAKAVAGEAGVPFFSISGSDFVEMFVGVGAARVRDLFEQGKKNAPCIIFIDEIDAVGRHRGAGMGGGNDEREQTLNQLLVEMDGFESTEGVILIAATNRPDVLDPALLRPGRFDRQVTVPLPDIRGREEILKVHMQKVALAADVEADVLARGTPGFSGADLANLVNEAALMGARRNKRLVDMDDFEAAKDKVMMGAERRSAVMTEDQQRTTAVHEAGHAICSLFIDGPTDPLHKVTIIPRGRALGVTMSLPEEDKVTYDKPYLENQIAMLFGGRIAEEQVLNQMTTGASNDIEKATDLARKMVTVWGMSSLGTVNYGQKEGDVFLGRDYTQRQDGIAGATAEAVDKEVRAIIERGYERCAVILKKHRKELDMLSDALLEHETLDKSQIDDLMAGKAVVRKNRRTPRKAEEKATATKAKASTKKTSTAAKKSKAAPKKATAKKTTKTSKKS